MDSYRIQEVSKPGEGEPRRCTQPGCYKATREGKPFCTRHIAGQLYVQELLARLDGQRQELEQVRKRGAIAVDPGGLTAREMLREVTQNGARGLKRLARDMGLDVVATRAYVDALVRRGRLRWAGGARVALAVPRAADHAA